MPEESAGVIPVHKVSGDILLVRHLAGHWGFPKGHIEAGESATQAALREFKEETGLDKVKLGIEPIVKKYAFEKNGAVISKTVTYFVGTVENKNVTIRRDELDDFAWLPYSQALERITYSGDVLESANIRGQLSGFTPK